MLSPATLPHGLPRASRTAGCSTAATAASLPVPHLLKSHAPAILPSSTDAQPSGPERLWSAAASSGTLRSSRRARTSIIPQALAELAAPGIASLDLTKVVATLLGYVVLAASCFRSVPQIVKIIQNKSAEGLSIFSCFSELLCYTVVVAYNFNRGYPFSTFGEIAACWAQDVVLIGLILKFKRKSLPVIASVFGAFGIICYVLFSGLCPMPILTMMQMSTIFVMATCSRIPQIMLNAKRGNAGMMSLTTCVLNVLGNAVRIFTTIVLTKDVINLSASMTQGVLNSILLYQTVLTRRGLPLVSPLQLLRRRQASTARQCS